MPDESGKLADHAGPPRADWIRLRQSVLDTAAQNPAIGPIDESIKWGEPSFTPAKRGIGSSVRIAPCKDGKIAMNFICHTGLVDRFREIYGDKLAFEGNRTIIVDPAKPLQKEELGHCIAMALTYFRSKA